MTQLKLKIIKKSIKYLGNLSFPRLKKIDTNPAIKSIKLTGCPSKNFKILCKKSINLPDSSLKSLRIPSEAVWSQYGERKMWLAKGNIGLLNM